jgi:Family of unknown function (DUF6010)
MSSLTIVCVAGEARLDRSIVPLVVGLRGVVAKGEVSQMGQGYSLLGFMVIVILYVVIGLMSVAGTICITRKIFAPKPEQIFYGLFLILIAGFYLAFTAYFGMATAWRLESAAALAFVALGLLGTRVPFAIIIGYLLHGPWDVLHELQAHGGFSAFEPGQVTAIPLAYGVFCATYDFGIAAYAYMRRADWSAAWTSGAQ